MTLNDLKIEGNDDLSSNHLTSIEISEATHVHGSCDLTFALPSNFDPAKIQQWNKLKVTVKAKAKDKDEIIFCGLVSFCKLDERPEGKFLFVRVLTLSCQMESALKSKSYQSPKKNLSDVVKDVKTPYADAQFDVCKDAEYPFLIYRNNLSDWGFFKSLAEQVGQVLFVNSKTDKLWLSVGFKAFAEFECDKEKTKLLRQVLPMDFYKRIEQNLYEGARSLYFLETDLVTPELKIGVGSSVKYDGQKLAVIASRIYVDGVNLFNEIKLRDPEGCLADAWDVLKHVDEFYYIGGKVLESKDNNVKVQFNCDTEQSKDDALEIPFEAGANNYLYNMPDDGETVCVYVDYLREAALLTLRTNDKVDADYKNRSFKVKDSSLVFDPSQFSFAVGADKTKMTQEKSTSIKTDKTITFESKGDIYIQSAQGTVPDNQLKLVVLYEAGLIQYTAMLGQPPSAALDPVADTVGKLDSAIKNEGAKAEAVELSDLAKELNTITKYEAPKAEEKQDAGGGAGGTLKLTGKNSSTVQQVSNSFITLDGKKFKLKTIAFNHVAYTQVPGGGTGSLKDFGGGNPGNSSVKIKVEDSVADRERVNAEESSTEDNKILEIEMF
ncbi:MAG: hypothetical protein IKE46_06530 [Selenomonadaceae bacterium]|nr:hypothetical protein [Selenomonadaceae bacterium]